MGFDELDDGDARALLLRCLSAPDWAEQVLAGRPYETEQDLTDAADRAARRLSDGDVEAALAGHPRIGERAASSREQSGVDAGDVSTAEQLADGNRAYEARFGHVFLIRAAGRTGPEILGELRRRLDNPPEVERDEMLDNLRQIMLVRLDQEA
jgi:2-oxo-4-hydroxy-4-carboxy-5-ureidoimidazoline decarboxylase